MYYECQLFSKIDITSVLQSFQCCLRVDQSLHLTFESIFLYKILFFDDLITENSKSYQTFFFFSPNMLAKTLTRFKQQCVKSPISSHVC